MKINCKIDDYKKCFDYRVMDRNLNWNFLNEKLHKKNFVRMRRENKFKWSIYWYDK